MFKIYNAIRSSRKPEVKPQRIKNKPLDQLQQEIDATQAMAIQLSQIGRDQQKARPSGLKCLEQVDREALQYEFPVIVPGQNIIKKNDRTCLSCNLFYENCFRILSARALISSILVSDEELSYFLGVTIFRGKSYGCGTDGI